MRVRTAPIVLVERRMTTVDRSDPDACHLWPGGLAGPGRLEGKGYGVVSGRRPGTIERVPRVVLEAKLGRPLLPGMFALHSCDNPPCVNARHLHEGTQGRNQADARARGRTLTGERNPGAKLSAEQVRAIRVDARPHKLIALDFGITAKHVQRLKAGGRWQHLELAAR